jgi:hypothetical protein
LPMWRALPLGVMPERILFISAILSDNNST